jgi:hypothetical protein
LREEIDRGRKAGTLTPEVCDAFVGVLDLYNAVSDQARRDDSFLQAWAMNFRLEGFTKPNESGARTLLPGLTAAVNQLAMAFPDEEPPSHLRSVRDDH